MNDLSFLDGVSLKQGFLLGVSENLMFGDKLMLFNVNEKFGLLKDLEVEFGGDFADAGAGEGGEVGLGDEDGSIDVFGVHAVGVGLHGLDADLGFVGEENVDLVAGVVLLGLVDDQVLALHVLAVLGLELMLRHVDLEVTHQKTPVPKHLHHRLPYSVQTTHFLLRKHHLPP